jgi:hypothetical protein
MSVTKKYIYIGILVIGIILLLVVYGSTTIEGWQGWQGIQPVKNESVLPPVTEAELVPLRKELETYFITTTQALCPAFNAVKEEIAKSGKGDPVAIMTKEAGGAALYDCRSYDDHLQVPAVIDKIIRNTTTYLYFKLSKLMKNVDAALACKPIEVEEETAESFVDFQQQSHYSDVVEYFADVCSPEQMKKREEEAATKAAEQAAKVAEQAAKTCVDPKKIDYRAQKLILDSRIAALKGVVKDPLWIGQVAELKKIVDRFLEIKAKIDAGTLMPNCGGDKSAIPMGE